jgi:hypothetical protein
VLQPIPKMAKINTKIKKGAPPTRIPLLISSVKYLLIAIIIVDI